MWPCTPVYTHYCHNREILFEACVFGEQIWVRLGTVCLGKCPIVLVVQLGNNTHIHLNDDMGVVNVVAFNANKLAALYETQF